MLDDDRRDALDRRPILTIFGCHERDVPLFFLSFFFLFLHDDFIVESESMLLIGHQSPCPFAYMGNNSLIHLAKASVYLLLLRGYIYIYLCRMFEICRWICNSFFFPRRYTRFHFSFPLKVRNISESGNNLSHVYGNWK